jgi:hypothetical protein
MLHIPSYNMGLAAGIAWKAAGKDFFYLADVKAETEEDKFIREILVRTSYIRLFMLSSFLEGFHNGYHTNNQAIEG